MAGTSNLTVTLKALLLPGPPDYGALRLKRALVGLLSIALIFALLSCLWRIPGWEGAGKGGVAVPAFLMWLILSRRTPWGGLRERASGVALIMLFVVAGAGLACVCVRRPDLRAALTLGFCFASLYVRRFGPLWAGAGLSGLVVCLVLHMSLKAADGAGAVFAGVGLGLLGCAPILLTPRSSAAGMAREGVAALLRELATSIESLRRAVAAGAVPAGACEASLGRMEAARRGLLPISGMLSGEAVAWERLSVAQFRLERAARTLWEAAGATPWGDDAMRPFAGRIGDALFSCAQLAGNGARVADGDSKELDGIAALEEELSRLEAALLGPESKGRLGSLMTLRVAAGRIVSCVEETLRELEGMK